MRFKLHGLFFFEVYMRRDGDLWWWCVHLLVLFRVKRWRYTVEKIMKLFCVMKSDNFSLRWRKMVGWCLNVVSLFCMVMFRCGEEFSVASYGRKPLAMKSHCKGVYWYAMKGSWFCVLWRGDGWRKWILLWRKWRFFMFMRKWGKMQKSEEFFFKKGNV